MPYTIKHEGNRFNIYKENTNIKLGSTATTKEALQKYLSELNMNESNYMSLTNLLKEADDDSTADPTTDAASDKTGDVSIAEPDAEKKETPKASGFKVKFNAGKVKHYNKFPVLGNEGDLYKINKDGILVSVDNKTIFVNFEDIIEEN